MSKVNAAFLQRINYYGWGEGLAISFHWKSTPEGFDYWNEMDDLEEAGTPLPSKARRILRRWRAADRKFRLRKEGKH